MSLLSIYKNISKFTEIPGHEVSVRYKMCHFRYFVIHDFPYNRIFGNSMDFLASFDKAYSFLYILINGMNQIIYN